MWTIKQSYKSVDIQECWNFLFFFVFLSIIWFLLFSLSLSATFSPLFIEVTWTECEYPLKNLENHQNTKAASIPSKICISPGKKYKHFIAVMILFATSTSIQIYHVNTSIFHVTNSSFQEIPTTVDINKMLLQQK